MGLQFIEKGAYILKPKEIEILKKAYGSSGNVVSELENANGASKDSPFRDGLYAHSEKEARKTERFLDVLIKNIGTSS